MSKRGTLKGGYQLPDAYVKHLLAQRWGFRSWSEVEEYPHAEVVLMLDILELEYETRTWRQQHRR